MSDGLTSADCNDITFQFQQRETYVKYILEDPDDGCFPYSIEGKWYVDETKDEKIEAAVEKELEEDLFALSIAEKKALVEDNDMLVEELKSEINKLTED